MRLLSVALVLVVLASCAVIQPPTGPGTDWPCGTNGKQCTNGLCCPSDSDCGGEVLSCPKGSCCFRDENTQPIPAGHLQREH